MTLRILTGLGVLGSVAAALSGCGGDDNVATSGCDTGRGSPITADQVLGIFNAAGYELRIEECDGPGNIVADLNNQAADDAEARVGHLLCDVRSARPPGRRPGISGDSPGTSGLDHGFANVSCTLYTRGNDQDASQQVAKFEKTIAELAAT